MSAPVDFNDIQGLVRFGHAKLTEACFWLLNVRDAPAARAFGEALELVGGLVDGLQVALVLELPPGGRDVGVPALGHAPPR